MKNESWVGKVLFYVHFSVIVHHSRKSEQELKQGRFTDTGSYEEAMEESCLLACFPWLTQPAFL